VSHSVSLKYKLSASTAADKIGLAAGTVNTCRCSLIFWQRSSGDAKPSICYRTVHAEASTVVNDT